MHMQWNAVNDIDIDSRLSISDTSYFYDEPVIVSLPKARYRVTVRLISPEGDQHVAAVRLVSSDEEVSRGKRVGSVLVDFGQVGFCDRDAVEKAFEAIADDEMSLYYDQLDTTTVSGQAVLPGAVKIAYVRPGFGDGTYPVYELLRPDGTVIGVELDCLVT